MTKMCNENLRKIRRDKNYSQEYIANLLNISLKAYSDIEQGKTILKYEMIIKLTSILNISPDNICKISLQCKSKHEIINSKIIDYLKNNNISIPKELFE
ncbi:helix-turn-helix transcriptional regulator [Flavobacterium gelidilacus]|uniref:helix-turn-helix domain-containing protein n=1 Tax=Flavobacterium gelidilacus TaxID=206041 RepID=UPI000688CCA9|nr:helix-turn-helix transcriptional regulator [Flavobacterium gelidilacus]